MAFGSIEHRDKTAKIQRSRGENREGPNRELRAGSSDEEVGPSGGGKGGCAHGRKS